MKETYKEMKARHMRETGALYQSLKDGPETIRKKELRAIARIHHKEIMDAWRDEEDGEAFVFDMMLDGAYFGLELEDILEYDGLTLTRSEDREKAQRLYAKALAFYEDEGGASA
jgi:hypothetical protein